MTVVNIHEAKTHLSKLIERAQNGEEIVIGKAGRPVAKLVPFKLAAATRVPGRLKGKIWIADDFDAFPPELEASWYAAKKE